MLLAGSTRYFVYVCLICIRQVAGFYFAHASPNTHQINTFFFFSFSSETKIFDRNAWRVTASPSEEKHRSDPFVGFFSFQFPKSKTIQRSMSPKWIGFIRPVLIYSSTFFPYYGFRRSYVACCMLISQACFTKLTSIHLLNFCGLRVLFLFFHRRGTLSHHPARHTHTHTPHRSTVTRSRIFRKDFQRERENSEQPRSEASIEASYRKSWAEKTNHFKSRQATRLPL